MAIAWLVDIPPELRQIVYRAYFTTEQVSINTPRELLTDPAGMHQYIARPTTAWSNLFRLLLVRKQVNAEAQDAFLEHTVFAITGYAAPLRLINKRLPKLSVHHVQFDLYSDPAIYSILRRRCARDDRKICSVRLKYGMEPFRGPFADRVSFEICMIRRFLRFVLKYAENACFVILSSKKGSVSPECTVRIDKNKKITVTGMLQKYIDDGIDTLLMAYAWEGGQVSKVVHTRPRGGGVRYMKADGSACTSLGLAIGETNGRESVLQNTSGPALPYHR